MWMLCGGHQTYIQVLKCLLPGRGNQVFGVNAKYNSLRVQLSVKREFLITIL